MTTATAEEEVNSSNEEPASKKMRLDDEPSSDTANPLKDDSTGQMTDTSSISPTKVQKVVAEIFLIKCAH